MDAKEGWGEGGGGQEKMPGESTKSSRKLPGYGLRCSQVAT